MDFRKGLAVSVALSCGLWAGAASALSMNVAIGDDAHHNWTLDTGTVTGGHSDPGLWDFGWDLTSDADPFIQINSLSFTNTSTSSQHFVITLNGLVSPSFNPANVVDARMGYDWASDGNITLSNISWSGTINGVVVSSIFGSDLNIDSGGMPLTGTVATVTDPAVTFVYDAGAPITSMGMIFAFDLSAGDSIDFNARLEITPVPVPGALLLLASGLLGLGAAACRR